MPDLLERQMLRARNGLAYLTGANRPAVGQSPRDLVWKRDQARLWRYRCGRRRYRPPVLIVHSLVSKSYVLDLLPDTSLVRYLAGEGFDVFLLDWMPPGPADAENTLETYAGDYIPGAIGALLEDADAKEVTLIGYCFGGILTLLATAGHPELPVRNMMVMATPCGPPHPPSRSPDWWAPKTQPNCASSPAISASSLAGRRPRSRDRRSRTGSGTAATKGPGSLIRTRNEIPGTLPRE